eukprot:TRINITY_DN7209_c0_g1_i1.p1 TRINITY_DN7209_c0_g1~~TRINITY_DN7209_c0_g1_i1.p1  ORF type:complete len:989 (+),score=194.67 TRINITY_DN7209_c0_g1_i1:267-3233(+)
MDSDRINNTAQVGEGAGTGIEVVVPSSTPQNQANDDGAGSVTVDTSGTSTVAAPRITRSASSQQHEVYEPIRGRRSANVHRSPHGVRHRSSSVTGRRRKHHPKRSQVYNGIESSDRPRASMGSAGRGVDGQVGDQHRGYMSMDEGYYMTSDTDADDDYDPLNRYDYDDDDDDFSDTSSDDIGSETNSTTVLEERKEVLNTLFGIKPWKGRVHHRDLGERSNVVKSLYETPRPSPNVSPEILWSFGNVMWAVCFGWWLCLGYFFVAGVFALTYVGMPYARLAVNLGRYYFWPFGKFIIRQRGASTIAPSTLGTIGEHSSLLRGGAAPSTVSGYTSSSSGSGHTNNDMFDSGTGAGGGGPVAGAEGYEPIDLNDKAGEEKKTDFLFMLWFFMSGVVLFPMHVVAFIGCWMPVVTIPIAKVNLEGMKLLVKDPSTLDVCNTYPGPGEEVLLCTYSAVNIYYYKYSLDGLNVILVNLIPFVLLSIFVGYVLPHLNPDLEVPDPVMFGICLLAVIPLSYFLGMAISSVSAQTSFAVAAFLNTSFGSFVELMLYFSAIRKGGLGQLIQSGVTGTLLGALLLLPGLAMTAGGLKYKEQKFNPMAAGVSSVLLMISVIGSFMPTAFYRAYGQYVMDCSGCSSTLATGDVSLGAGGVVDATGSALNCTRCTYLQVANDDDPVYRTGAKPLMYAISVILPVAYIIGLLFTLKTHAHIIYKKKAARRAILKHQSHPAGSHHHHHHRTPRVAHASSSQTSQQTSEQQHSSEASAQKGVADVNSASIASTQGTVQQSLPPHGGSRSKDQATSHQKDMHVVLVDIDDDEEQGEGHDAPEWSKMKCYIVMGLSAIAFALISELLADTVEPALESIGVGQGFAGLTIIALIPNTAEFVNAVQFALQGNVALAIEIAGAVAVQVCMLQMPVLVVMSAIMGHGETNEDIFTLIFPSLDLFAVILSVIVLNYISVEGKTNYFYGTSFIIIYLLLVVGYYFVPQSDHD